MAFGEGCYLSARQGPEISRQEDSVTGASCSWYNMVVGGFWALLALSRFRLRAQVLLHRDLLVLKTGL